MMLGVALIMSFVHSFNDHLLVPPFAGCCHKSWREKHDLVLDLKENTMDRR